MNDLLMDIISLKNRLMPGSSIDDKSRRIFNMACYNLDTFRSHIFQKGILNDLNLDINTLDEVKNDDVALLKLGINWIIQVVFNNKSIPSI
jgi:hypothetical protein